MNIHRLITRGLAAVLLLGSAVLHAQPAPTPNEYSAVAAGLLQAIDLGGSQSSVKWTDLSNKNATLAPVSGTGTIGAFASGYSASRGFYSFSNSYAVNVAANASFDVSNIVLQLALQPNPDFWNPGVKGNPEAILFYDYNNQDHGTYGHANPDPGASWYNTALNGISADVADYHGGPVLSYVVGGDTFVFQGQPVAAGFLATAVDPNADEHTQGAPYVSFAWQWDLSFVEGTITSVSIDIPVITHQNTIGAQLNLGDSFSGSVIPEPSAFAAIAGLGALGCVFLRRRRA